MKQRRSIMRDATTVSRRTLLGRALAVCAATTIMASEGAATQPKVSHVDARYQNYPKGQQRCEICVNFQPPNACQFVENPIGAKGWCQYFAAKENAH